MSTFTKNRRCTGKKRHDTRAEAEVHRRRLIAAGAWDQGLVVYGECKECGGYHVGHRSRAKRNSGRRSR